MAEFENIEYYKEMKETLNYFNYKIETLLNANDDLDSFYKFFNLNNNKEINDTNDMFIDGLLYKLNNNKYIITLINDYLMNNCKHCIIEDYIEGGVDDNMIKIKYCNKCELTF